jgi:hypothetical protein
VSSPTCYVVEPRTPACDLRHWLQLAPPADPGWLARPWRADEARDAILLVSGDESRGSGTQLFDASLSPSSSLALR